MRSSGELSKLKEELTWLETTPWYLSKDGMPNLWLIVVGFIWGWVLVIAYRWLRKRHLRRLIAEIETDKIGAKDEVRDRG